MVVHRSFGLMLCLPPPLKGFQFYFKYPCTATCIYTYIQDRLTACHKDSCLEESTSRFQQLLWLLNHKRVPLQKKWWASQSACLLRKKKPLTQVNSEQSEHVPSAVQWATLLWRCQNRIPHHGGSFVNSARVSLFLHPTLSQNSLI